MCLSLPEGCLNEPASQYGILFKLVLILCFPMNLGVYLDYPLVSLSILFTPDSTGASVIGDFCYASITLDTQAVPSTEKLLMENQEVYYYVIALCSSHFAQPSAIACWLQLFPLLPSNLLQPPMMIAPLLALNPQHSQAAPQSHPLCWSLINECGHELNELFPMLGGK